MLVYMIFAMGAFDLGVGEAADTARRYFETARMIFRQTLLEEDRSSSSRHSPSWATIYRGAIRLILVTCVSDSRSAWLQGWDCIILLPDKDLHHWMTRCDIAYGGVW